MVIDPFIAKLVLASAVVALGALVQGGVGYGLALMAAPLLALIDPRLVPGPLVFSGLALTVAMAVRDRDAIHFRGVGWALVGRIPGTVAGAVTLSFLAGNALGIVIGLLVLAAVAMTAVGPPVHPNRPNLLVAGLLSGFMGTTSAIGGPPVAIIYQHQPGSQIRATLSVYFTAGATMSLIALAVIGRFARFELLAAVAMLPGMMLGFILSTRLSRWLDRGRTRSAVLVVSAVSGISLVAREIL
jgi:uncharacterized protein